MSRWIEVEPLMENFGRLTVELWLDSVEEAEIVSLIGNAPSIDLVRCKECKKAHLTYDGDCKYCDEWKDDDGNYIEVYHDGNHYCSYGVRKESDE